MTESEKAKRRVIRTLAREVAYEVIYEHLDEYEHTPKKPRAGEEHGQPR